jgi:GxxExxY protein
MDKQAMNEIAATILDAAISVHREMGPGLLESVYQPCLAKELSTRGLQVATGVPVPLYYKGELLNKDFIIDLLVEGEIVVELKAVDVLLPVHDAQIISYLKLTGKRLGFLINFNVPLLKQGFKRFVNNF